MFTLFKYLVWLVIALVVFTVFKQFDSRTARATSLAYSEFMDQAKSGRIKSAEIEGNNILGLKAHQLVSRGIGYVPQTRNVFPSLTVVENLEMGCFLRPTASQRFICASPPSRSALRHGVCLVPLL